MVTIKRLALASFGAVGLSTLGFGQLIDVAFHGFGDPTPSGAAVLGSAGDVWNGIDASAGGLLGPYALVDSTGTLSSASITFTCNGAVHAASPPSQPLPALTHAYMFNNTGGTLDMLVHGLLDNTAYNLVMYVASDDGGAGDRGLVGFVTGSGQSAFSATGIPQPTFVNGANEVAMMATTDVSGILQIDMADAVGNTSNEIDMNGLQLSPVPEPAPLAAVGLGLLALVARRRRI